MDEGLFHGLVLISIFFIFILINLIVYGTRSWLKYYANNYYDYSVSVIIDEDKVFVLYTPFWYKKITNWNRVKQLTSEIIGLDYYTVEYIDKIYFINRRTNSLYIKNIND